MTPHNEANIDEIAKTVLMPGDPLRAKMIADEYLDNCKLVNQIRNMYAYTGTYKGKKITVMASGMGIPSIGIYSYELFSKYNVENIIRIGSTGAYTDSINLYDTILVTESYSLSSYAKVLNDYLDTCVKPSDELNKNIELTASKLNKNIIKGKIYSSDCFYGNADIFDLYNNKKCLGVEMESFGLFYNAKILGKNAACILTVSDNLITHEETTAYDRQNAFNDMIEIALETALKL